MNQFLTLIVLFVLTMQTVYFIFNATQREDLHKYEHTHIIYILVCAIKIMYVIKF